MAVQMPWAGGHCRAPRPWSALAAVVVVAGSTLLGACGSPPRHSNSAACGARSQIEGALGSLNRVDFTHLDKAQLQADLAALRSGVDRAQAAVGLSQNVELRQLGGVPYLQTVSNHIVGLQAEVARADPSSVDLARVQADLAAQTREGDRIANSIHGC